MTLLAFVTEPKSVHRLLAAAQGPALSEGAPSDKKASARDFVTRHSPFYKAQSEEIQKRGYTKRYKITMNTSKP